MSTAIAAPRRATGRLDEGARRPRALGAAEAGFAGEVIFGPTLAAKFLFPACRVALSVVNQILLDTQVTAQALLRGRIMLSAVEEALYAPCPPEIGHVQTASHSARVRPSL